MKRNIDLFFTAAGCIAGILVFLVIVAIAFGTALAINWL